MDITEMQAEEIKALGWTEVESSQVRRIVWLDPDTVTEIGIGQGDELIETQPDAPLLLVEFMPTRADREAFERRAGWMESDDPRLNEPRGSIYAYVGVPEGVAAALIASESVGRTLNASIKGAFAYRQLEVVTEVTNEAGRPAPNSAGLPGVPVREPKPGDDNYDVRDFDR